MNNNTNSSSLSNSPVFDKERDSLLKLKTLLEEKLNNSDSATASSSSPSSSTVNLVLRSSEVTDLLNAVSKSLNGSGRRGSLGNNNNNNNSNTHSLSNTTNNANNSNNNQNNNNNSGSPFSAQANQSLTHPYLNGSESDQNNNSAALSNLQGAKSPEDPFARVQPFSTTSPHNNHNRGSGSSSAAQNTININAPYHSNNNHHNSNPNNGSRRGRTQSVSFAARENSGNLNSNNMNDDIENSLREANNNNNNQQHSPFPFGQQQEFSGGSVEAFESRFSGLPIASRAAASREPATQQMMMNNAASLSPFEGGNNSGTSGGITPPTSARNHNNQQYFHSGNSGVKVDDLQLDLINARRKSAVCGVAPHLNLASPRREADYILEIEEETSLLTNCLNAVAQLYPSDFAGINDNANVMPPLDVNEGDFDALAFSETLQREGKIKQGSSTPECYTFVVVALHVLCKYRFMETFGTNPQRLAHFLVRLVKQFIRPPPPPTSDGTTNNNICFTGPLRTAVNVHCIHLILSDPRLGSQLTDIEIAACIFACLAARVGSLGGVSNEFLFRINHPYARLYPGWSPQEQVSVTIISELFRDFETTNPFDQSWWLSDEELDFCKANSGENGNAADDLDLMGGGGGENSNTNSGTPPPPTSDAARRGVVFTELVADLILTTDTRHQQWLFKECSDALKKAEGAAKGRARRGSIMFGDNSIIRVADMHRILRCLVHLSEQYAYIFQASFDSFRSWVGRWILETRSQGAAEQLEAVPITFHCRESTNSAEYHMQFVQIVVVPFVEMLNAALPRSFTVSLFDNTQKLGQLHATVLDELEQQQQQQETSPSLNIRLLSALMNCDFNQAENLRATALGRFTTSQEGKQLLSNLPEQFVTEVLQKQTQLLLRGSSNSNSNNGNNSNGVESAIMQTVMRHIDNKLRVVELNKQQQQQGGNTSNSRELLRNIEVEVIRMVRSGKPEILRPSLRDPNLRDEDIVDALLDNNQTPLGNVFASKSDALLALLLRVVRYTKTL